MFFYLLGLGSNIRPDDNMSSALEKIAQLGEVCSVSERITTAPVGDTFHGEFRNQMAVLKSDLLPGPLKQRLQQIEVQLGREPKSPARKTKDRTIDIDILGQAGNADSCRSLPLEESYFSAVARHWPQDENV